MSEAEVVGQISQFIAEAYAVGQVDFTAEDELLVEGIIDSLGMLELVLFVEEKFQIVVDDTEVDLDNFGTVSGVAAFVLSKLDGAE